MTNTLDAREFQSKLQRLDALLREAERFTDPAAQGCTRQIVQAVPGVRVLILTTFETDSQVIQALKAGASGFVLKDSSVAAIISSIIAVMSGERVSD